MLLGYLDTLISFAAVMLGVSLLITILVQASSAALRLRGSNLRWGLTTLIRIAEPKIADQAEDLVDEILHDPLVSDSAITIIRQWSWLEKTPLIGRYVRRCTLASSIRLDELLRSLKRLAAEAGRTTPDKTAKPTAKPNSQAVSTSQAAQALLAKFQEDGGGAVADLAADLAALDPADAKKAQDLIDRLGAQVKALGGSAQADFESLMDRVAQRFALHVRAWTVGLSLVVAFALHLDALQLIEQLSIDAQFRASVELLANSIGRKADDVFNRAADADAKTELAQLRGEAGAITKGLGDAGIQLLPNPYPGWDFTQANRLPNRHFWGVLASAGLLSLGAPFWFNTLGSLSSLRPILAEKRDDKEEDGAS